MKTSSSLRAPEALLIILAVLFLAVVLTWLVPAGEFERRTDDGRTHVVPGTFKLVEANPLPWYAFFTAPIRGFADRDAATIVAFVLLIGGAFAVINATGAIAAVLNWTVHRTGDHPGRRKLVIPALMLAFSVGGNTFGMSEEVLVFLMITLPLARRMGWDPIVGLAIPFVGAGVGFSGAAFNPFTVGIAQGLSQLPVFSGWPLRMVMWAVLTAIAIAFVMRYAARIERDPSRSLMAARLPAEPTTETGASEPLTVRRVIVLLLFAAGIGVLVLGVNRWGWYIEEIAGLFLAVGFAAAVIGRLDPNDAARHFVSGARDMVGAALLIALSKSALLVMQDGRIIDTILHTLSQTVSGLPAVVSSQVMLAVQFCINFFVPSGSGQAALTMPVMAPLSDLLGIPRQSAVLAFQLGDGLCNFIIPTSGVTMGALGIAGIPFGVWLRWVGGLTALLLLVGAVFLAASVALPLW
jgi:uncharacterized ion transporter superfamily protein YfcC